MCQNSHTYQGRNVRTDKVQILSYTTRWPRQALFLSVRVLSKQRRVTWGCGEVKGQGNKPPRTVWGTSPVSGCQAGFPGSSICYSPYFICSLSSLEGCGQANGQDAMKLDRVWCCSLKAGTDLGEHLRGQPGSGKEAEIKDRNK